MYLVVWEFRVTSEQEAAFRLASGPEGEWVRLFRTGAGYLGTELLQDERDKHRYLTVDRWSSRAAHDAFRAGWPEEYRALDQAFAALTEHETQIGSFTALAD